MLKELIEADLRARGCTQGTIREWERTAQRFQDINGLKKRYGREDVIRWLNDQRDNKIGNYTIQVRLSTIKLIFAILEIPFPYIKLPRISPKSINRPAFTKDEIHQLISRSRMCCSPEQICRLVIATIYGLRCIELAQLRPEDLVGKLYVDTRKGGEPTEHLIPPEIQGFIVPLEPCSEGRMERVFRYICERTELDFPPKYNWHAIRRSLTTELVYTNVGALTIARFIRWSQTSIQRRFGTLAVYDQSEQERVDTEIFSVHPFLPFWREG